MSPATSSRLPQVLERREAEILDRWMKEQLGAATARRDLMSEGQLREQSKEFLGLLKQASSQGHRHGCQRS